MHSKVISFAHDFARDKINEKQNRKIKKIIRSFITKKIMENAGKNKKNKNKKKDIYNDLINDQNTTKKNAKKVLLKTKSEEIDKQTSEDEDTSVENISKLTSITERYKRRSGDNKLNVVSTVQHVFTILVIVTLYVCIKKIKRIFNKK